MGRLLKRYIQIILSIYRQWKLIEALRREGVEIHYPLITCFDRGKLQVSPPPLYRPLFCVLSAREAENWLRDDFGAACHDPHGQSQI